MTETSSNLPSTSERLTRHVMVDFNQMKTFSAEPLIMVDGRRDQCSPTTRADGTSTVSPGCSRSASGTGTRRSSTRSRRSTGGVSFSSPIMTTTDRALELAAELIRVTGGRYDVVKQLNSGSEATEAALKMARQYHRQSGSPERYKTISFYRSYHGATMGALTSTGWPQLRTPYEPFLTGGIHAHPPIPGSCRACAGLVHARLPRAAARRRRARGRRARSRRSSSSR